MRVLSVLSVVLSLLCLSGVSAQYALTSASTVGSGGVGGTGGYIFNTSTVGNPPLTLQAGNTYYFDITAITTTSPPHPFIFSSASGSVAALDATVFNFTVGTGCTLSNNGYVADLVANAANTCILSLAVNATAINQTTIYYKCTLHSNMVGQVIVSSNNTVAATTAAPTTAAPTTVAPTTASPTTAAPTNGSSNATTAAPSTAAPTTVAPTTAAPTTAAPTTAAPTTGGTITSNTFTIVGNSGINAYIFLSDGVRYLNPTLKVTAGMDVKFTIDAAFVNSFNHPLAFSNNGSTFMVPNTFNTTDVFPTNQQTYTINTASTCTTTYFGVKAVAATAGSTCTITVPASVVTVQPTFYYRCVKHPNMIGAINIVAGPTTAPSSASTVALSGLTILFAMIVAMMA